MTVAVIIIVLLSKDMKLKSNVISPRQQNDNTFKVKHEMKEDNGFFPFVITLFGAIAIFYGFSGVFTSDSIFHTMDLMTSESFMLYFFFFLGLTLFIYGASLLLKRYLSK